MPRPISPRKPLLFCSQGAADLASEGCATSTSTGSPFVHRPGVTEIKGWRDYASMDASQWERHRATIKELYIDKGKTLKDVTEIMHRDYGFNATWVFCRLIRSSLLLI